MQQSKIIPMNDKTFSEKAQMTQLNVNKENKCFLSNTYINCMNQTYLHAWILNSPLPDPL